MKKVKVVKSMKQEQAVESKEQDWFGCPDIPQGEVTPISKEGLNSMIDDRRFIVAVQRTEWLKSLTSDEVKSEVVKLYTSLDLDRAAKESAQLQSEWATAQNMLLKERQETLFEKKRAQLNELENTVYDVLFTKASSLVSQVKLLAKNQEFAELLTGDLVSPLFHRTNNGYILNTGTARIAFEFGPVTARAKMAKARLISQPRKETSPTEHSYESQRIIVNGKEYKWKRTAARSLLKDNTISTKDAVSRLREAGYSVEE
jgi:hypothetical protein